ncbi:Uncharacterised protein [Vibrio cholerae]|nr:Uncharacterised protein [Vibrio cholerae]CSD04687.1 Uncharacterised protein [Vibrio cholerae]
MTVLLQHFHANRALTGNHQRVIERRYKGVALLFG